MEQQPAVWIWYPGDFEVRLHEKMSAKRRARGAVYPAFWRLDRHYSNVKFRYTYDLPQEEQIVIAAEGEFALYLDGKDNHRSNQAEFTLPAGRHEIVVSVFSDTEMPALLISGKHVSTSSEWEASSYQNDWLPVGSWTFNSINNRPSQFRLQRSPQQPSSSEVVDGHVLLDFAKETFGYLRFHQLAGVGKVKIYYGESRAEALSCENCIHIYEFDVTEAKREATKNTAKLSNEANTELEPGAAVEDVYIVEQETAFRYVWIHADPQVKWGHISMLYEYVPLSYRSSFQCSDEKLSKIYEMSLYTLHLNTREFFLDGIKRDRWVWSGDAYQSFLMNYYSFFDLDVTRRTLVALRGKDPVNMHINTILDYSFYWFISLYDYYLYTGDVDFIRQNYERAVSLMEFCLQQRNEEGLVEGRKQDWVFVDWADLNNTGAVSTEQILLTRGLEAMSQFAVLMGDHKAAANYETLAAQIKETTLQLFWDEAKGGMLHHRVSGETQPLLTKHASMFAMIYGYLSPQQRESVIQQVMLNPDIPKIRTPYMRFHELAALCESGEHDYVLEELIAYWGGMIDLGATTFWEEYDPALTGDENYRMYDLPFGKSLCHAWGASPIYLLGKYYIGVRPLAPGYAAYVVEPKLGSLSWLKGIVPTAHGEVEVEMDETRIRVRATYGDGKLRYAHGGEVLEAAIPADGSWLEVSWCS